MFREFKVGDLFDGSTGDTDLKKEHLDSQGYPVVTAGVDNLGIAGYSSTNAKVLPANTLTVDMFGNCYFRPFEYKMVTHARVFSLSLKDGQLTPETGLYICTMFNWLRSKYNYSNMCSYKKIKAESIQLPVKLGTDEVNYTEDDIDWAYMESYIHELEESYIHELEESYIQELDAYLKETGLDDYTLTDDEREVLEREPVFKEFEVGELFETYTVSKKLTKAALSLNGTVPVYSSDTRNNGVLGYTEQVPTFIVNAVQPTYVIFGDHTRTINIVHESFCVMDNVKVLSPKFDLSDETLLYIKTVWLKGIPVLGYARHWSVAKDVALFLPVKQGTDDVDYTEADIDWVYMDAYVRVMEKLVIADVVDYKNEMIATTKGLIKN